MGFWQAIGSVFSKYVQFGGRAPRSEYWYWALFYLIASIGTGVVDFSIDSSTEAIGPVNALFSIATFLPSLAVLARRLHDIDKTAWWMLIVLIPVVGAILLIIWLCKSGSKGANKYGPDPLATP